MEGTGSCSWFKKHESVYGLIFVLFLGQIISFIMATTSFASSYLASRGVNAPIAQAFLTYTGLTSVYGSIMLFRRKKLLVPWYYYALLAFVDLQGNSLSTKAFQYTSITSVALFDCWTTVWVMILTWIFIGTRYTVWQCAGAATCVLGLGFALLSDARIDGGGGSSPVLGDFLVMVATIFYALSNVGEEFCVKQKDLVEVISMLGVFGLLMSTCQIIVLERRELEAIEWSTDIILAFAGYMVGTCLNYCLVSFLLKLNGATLFNLSALTSDMWAVVIRILFYHEEVDWLYYVSFAIVVVGLIIYSTTETSPAPLATDVDEILSVEYHVLGEDSSESRDGSLKA